MGSLAPTVHRSFVLLDTQMASVPPTNPNRIDPQAPPDVRPPAPEPSAPEPPGTEPLSPDIDEPGRCPDETPCPE